MLAGACGDIRRIHAHSIRTELVPALDRVSVVCGEGLYVGKLVAAALLTVLAAATQPSANHCWS